MPTIYIEVPLGLGADLAAAIEDHPIANHLSGGPASTGAVVAEVSPTTCKIAVSFPDPPKPTIPELIARWHADPTAENRKALRTALAEHRTAFIHRSGLSSTVFFATERQGVPVMEVY